MTMNFVCDLQLRILIGSGPGLYANPSRVAKAGLVWLRIPDMQHHDFEAPTAAGHSPCCIEALMSASTIGGDFGRKVLS